MLYKKLNRSMYAWFAGIIVIALTLDLGITNGITAGLILIGTFLLSIFYFVYSVKKAKKEFDLLGDKNTQPITSDSLHIDESSGSAKEIASVNMKLAKKNNILTESDMSLFEEEISNVNTHLNAIEQAMNKSKTVKNIMEENDRWESLQIFYQSLIESPERLTDVSDFAYVNLPYLSKLVTIHIKIEDKEIIDDHMLSALKESEKSIKKLADLLKQDYLLFRRKDIDELKNHLKLVDAMIDKNKKREGTRNA